MFKGKIVEMVKEETNAMLNAKVDFGDFDLSLIASFPSFTFEINDVSVINKAPFDGDTLVWDGTPQAATFECDGGKLEFGNFKLWRLSSNCQ